MADEAPQDSPEDKPATEPSPSMREAARRFLGQLFDLQMREIITTRMLPIIYGLAIAGAALVAVYSTVWGFTQSLWAGLGWLLVAGPALFLAIVISVRVLLEFVLTLFRIARYMDVLGSQIEGISDQMDSIDADLPRIQFWRTWTRK